jgi:membrane protein DedA with SNARE-associated domain
LKNRYPTLTAFKKFWVITGAVYLLLLIFSWSIQWLFQAQKQPNKYETVDSVVHKGQNIAVHSLTVGKEENQPLLFLIPDAYHEAENLIPLAVSLSDSFGVIIPMLDKGGLRNFVSNQDRGELIANWLQNYDDTEINIAGFRYGGLVAMEVAAHESISVESLILIQSMGIEEIHFLGNYRINRSVYSLMVPAFTLFNYGFPHFGAAGDLRFNRHFISTMLAMDQRNIESVLRHISIPTLILQSTTEPQIPVQTAREIYRLVPQSLLQLVENNPDRITEETEPWAYHIRNFLRQVEDGTGVDRSMASEDRIDQAQEPFTREDINELSGKALLVLISFLILISLVSEDSACIAGGLLYATGLIGFQHAFVGSIIGIISADLLIYAMGRWLGYPVLQMAPFKWFIKREDINRARDMFDARGAEILIATRFIPGTRLPVYLSAGILKTKFWPFLAYFITSLLVWAPLLIWVTSIIGQPMIEYIDLYQEYAILVIITAFLLIYVFIKYILPLGTVKGRREAVEKWRRFKEKRKRSNP